MAQLEAENMILLMGVTGSGKSYFINQLMRRPIVTESQYLSSCTSTPQLVEITIGKTKVAVVDTPGFDDTKKSDAEVLDQITQMLAAQYLLKVKLKGIIYLHRVTDNKMPGSGVKCLEMFKKICGEAALSNVVLVTTMWGKLKDEIEGIRRAQELRDKFWNHMIERGASSTSFDGTPDNAEGIVSMLIGKKPVVLDIQREVVDKGKSLEQTAAGGMVCSQLEEYQNDNLSEIKELGNSILVAERRRDRRAQQNHERRKKELEREQSKAKHQRDRMRKKPGEEMQEKIEDQMTGNKVDKLSAWRNGIAIFASIVGLSFTIVGAFFGVPV